MLKRISLRRVLSCLRIAFGNLCLLAILLSTGPILGTENAEASNTTPGSKEACAESVVGIEHRLVGICLFGPKVGFAPTRAGYLPPIRQMPAPVVGHRLTHELLAPLRC